MEPPQLEVQSKSAREWQILDFKLSRENLLSLKWTFTQVNEFRAVLILSFSNQTLRPEAGAGGPSLQGVLCGRVGLQAPAVGGDGGPGLQDGVGDQVPGEERERLRQGDGDPVRGKHIKNTLKL